MLSLVFSVIGVVGIGGAVALWLLAPALAQALLNTATVILKAILSTRLGVGVFVGTICLLVGLWQGDSSADARVRAEWAAANAAAKIKADNADRAIAAKAEAVNDKNVATETAADKATVEARNAYVAELEKRAAAACLATDDDLKRLRDLR